MKVSRSNLKALGRLIRRARGELTQRDLAQKSEVSFPTISNLENGSFKRPDPEKLQRIARALDLDPEDLFTLAGYSFANGLPSFGPYLRMRFGKELSATDRKNLEAYLEQLRHDHGGRSEKRTR